MQAVRKIMSISHRGGPLTLSKARREAATNLANRLLPIAQAASKWISQQRQVDQTNGHRFSNREELWKKYVEENADAATPGGLRKQLLNEFGPQQPMPPEMIRALKLTSKEKRAQQRSTLRFIASMYFSRGMVPKSLFFILGRSTPGRISPSIAVRRLAEKIAI